MNAPYLKELLLCLKSDKYETANTIGKMLNVSEKTVRTRIKELNFTLLKYGAIIESKPRYGFRIVVHDIKKYDELEKIIENSTQHNQIPNSVEERKNFLIAYLLNHDQFIKLNELSELLYVSNSTITASLKQIEGIFSQYRIDIERRPNFGIRINGNELNIRRCLSELFVKRNILIGFNKEHKEKELKKLVAIIYEYVKKYNIKFTETDLENFVSSLYIEKGRISRNKIVDLKKEDIYNLIDKEWVFIKELVKRLEQEFNISYTDSEEVYIALQLAGRRVVGNVEQDEMNFVIRGEIDQIVMMMLETVYHDVGMDFRNNFELRMSLNQHMVPFDIRIRYELPIKNKMLDEIKQNLKFAYWIAEMATSALENHYAKKISEDEIGYFAVLFALVLEKQNTIEEKYNILIVCGSGKGSSRLLKYKYMQEFGDYLNQIYTCDLQEVETFDFTKVDYVFTTITIMHHIPVPIIEVGFFLREKDIQNVKKVLISQKTDFLLHYYSESMFFNRLSGSTKEEVLQNMCEKIIKDKNVPSDFYQLILDREELGSTAYGNKIAVPHPLKLVRDESFVYVAILEQPIEWGGNEVQVVLLTVIGRKPDPNLQKFYELIISFIENKEAIETLIKMPDFKTFISILQNLNI